MRMKGIRPTPARVICVGRINCYISDILFLLAICSIEYETLRARLPVMPFKSEMILYAL